MRVLEVGVCGTDREISEGLFGVPRRRQRRSCSGTSRSRSSSATATASARGDLVTRDRPPLVPALPRLRRGLARLVPDRRLHRARHHAARRLRTRARRRGPGAADPDPARARHGSACSPSRRRSASARSGTRATIGGRQPWQLERALVVGAGAIGSSRPTCSGSRASRSGRRRSSPTSDARRRLGRALRLDGRRPLADLRAETRRLRPRRSRPCPTRS